MEVDLENHQKNTANFGKNLRKRKDSFLNRTAKHRAPNKKRNSRKKSYRRHKSLEPQVKNDLSKNAQIVNSSPSTASLGSVIYLGYYRKIPQLVTLEESNDSLENQNQNKVQEKITRKQSTKSSCNFNKTTSARQVDNSSNERRETNNLLVLLNDMNVSTVNKRSTRTRVRRCKN